MYCRTGNVEDGEKELRAALELDPSDVTAKKTIEMLRICAVRVTKGWG